MDETNKKHPIPASHAACIRRGGPHFPFVAFLARYHGVIVYYYLASTETNTTATHGGRTRVEDGPFFSPPITWERYRGLGWTSLRVVSCGRSTLDEEEAHDPTRGDTRLSRGRFGGVRRKGRSLPPNKKKRELR